MFHMQDEPVYFLWNVNTDKVLDAIEVAEKQIMSVTFDAATRIVSNR